jgi:hypothetical protein
MYITDTSRRPPSHFLFLSVETSQLMSGAEKFWRKTRDAIDFASAYCLIFDSLAYYITAASVETCGFSAVGFNGAR